jgi:hypothetical protein
MNIKNKLSPRRHRGHGELYGGTPCFLRALRVRKEIARRPQRRNFVPLRHESPCPLCLRVDILFSISIHKTMPRAVSAIYSSALPKHKVYRAKKEQKQQNIKQDVAQPKLLNPFSKVI